MALDIEGNHLCKLFYSENGKVFIRRVGTILVQRSDGGVQKLTGATLPDSIALYVGAQSEGGGILEIIDRDARGAAQSVNTVEPLYTVTTRPRFFSARDGFILIVGMLLVLQSYLLQ